MYRTEGSQNQYSELIFAHLVTHDYCENAWYAFTDNENEILLGTDVFLTDGKKTIAGVVSIDYLDWLMSKVICKEPDEIPEYENVTFSDILFMVDHVKSYSMNTLSKDNAILLGHIANNINNNNPGYAFILDNEETNQDDGWYKLLYIVPYGFCQYVHKVFIDRYFKDLDVYSELPEEHNDVEFTSDYNNLY